MVPVVEVVNTCPFGNGLRRLTHFVLALASVRQKNSGTLANLLGQLFTMLLRQIQILPLRFFFVAEKALPSGDIHTKFDIYAYGSTEDLTEIKSLIVLSIIQVK